MIQKSVIERKKKPVIEWLKNLYEQPTLKIFRVGRIGLENLKNGSHKKNITNKQFRVWTDHKSGETIWILKFSEKFKGKIIVSNFTNKHFLLA